MREKRAFFRVVLAAASWAAFAVSAAAQSGSGGTIVFAEGPEFSVVRGGAVTRFVPAADDFVGYELRDGDLLQTGGSTFVEVQLRPKGSMLKIAENSSFVFQRIGDPAEAGFQLLYGRVRAKVAKVSGGESFTVRSRQTTAGVRGTDFGFDSTVSPGGAVSHLVYAFSGEVVVRPIESPEAALPSFTVKAGEALAIDLAASVPFIERRPVEEAVRGYWTAFDFKGSPPIAPPVSGLAPAAPADGGGAELPVLSAPEETPPRYAVPDFRPYRSVIAAKNAAVGAAVLLNAFALAAGAAGAALTSSGDTGWGTPLLWTGGVLAGLSTATLAVSFFISLPEQ